jgi:hypothetical protein
MGDMSSDSVQVTTAVEKLARDFPATVLTPGSPRYEQENGKFWNRDNSDVRPAAIVTPSTAQETAYVPPAFRPIPSHRKTPQRTESSP